MLFENKFPNPQRFFIKSRDEWFISLLDKLNVPLSFYQIFRDSQLGQLFLPIESNRIKAQRLNEDPGPSLDDLTTLFQLIPEYKLIGSINELLTEPQNEHNFEMLGEKIHIEQINKEVNKLQISNFDWVSQELSEERLIELYLSSIHLLRNSIMKPVLDFYELEDFTSLLNNKEEKLISIVQSLTNILNPELITVENINYNWSDSSDEKQIEFTLSPPIIITKSDFHHHVRKLITFILELIRICDAPVFSFEYLSPILVYEMLIKIPYPEKSFIPLIRKNIKKLEKKIPPNHEIELILMFYQIYANGINPTNNRIFKKMYTNTLSKFNINSKRFWKNVSGKDEIIPVMWSSFSSAIAQLNHQINSSGSSNPAQQTCYAMLVELEKTFWKPSRSYLLTNALNSDIMFWSFITYFSSKKLKSAKAAIDGFRNLFSLFDEINLWNIAKTLSVPSSLSYLDRFSLLQKLISFGIETRSTEIYNSLENVLKSLNELLDEIKSKNTPVNIELEKEFETLAEIRSFIKNPVIPSS